jgi:hypothetical protein
MLLVLRGLESVGLALRWSRPGSRGVATSGKAVNGGFRRLPSLLAPSR